MMLAKLVSIVALAFACVTPSLCGDWNKQLAADYLDARQKEWFEWPVAASTGGPCVSCHTGLTYLLARPALRRALGEEQATTYETGLLAGLRVRIEQNKTMFRSSSDGPMARQDAGVDGVLCALSLTLARKPGSALSPEARTALDRMWSLQIREGDDEGAWPWFDLNLDPWETPDATFYGAALAALAAGNVPEDYREQTAVRERIAATWDVSSRHNRCTIA